MPTRRDLLQTLAALPALPLLSPAMAAEAPDPRNVATGHVIPDEGYCDQPYIVVTDPGHWLCVMTTGEGVEGKPGQHIVSTLSSDQGRTWSAPVDIEPAGGPEASWVMPLKVPGGRVYAFYTYNRDNLRSVRSNNPRVGARVDTMGVYAFRYSDDHGRTWSRERHEIPMRPMRIDRDNEHQGEVQFFWGVGKPITVRDRYAIFGFAKVGKWGDPGTMVESQGCFLRSDNILTERDPARLRWALLPEGDEGIRAPKGPVCDEANLVSLSDGTLYATCRTIDGYPIHAYSRDDGRTWTSEYMTYTPGGRRVKHPRAANFVRRFSNGRYLYWFHNHGGEAAHAPQWTAGATGYYRNRNPGWVCGGVERDGHIHWSQPEVLLYDDDPAVRISYPDFIEEKGRYYISETQKEVARVHEIDRTLLEGLWGQFDSRTVARQGLALDASGERVAAKASVPMPRLGSLADRAGFTIDLWARLRELTPGQVLFDARDAQGKGVALAFSDRFTLKLTMHDGRQEASWDSDPGTHPGTLRVGEWQHIAVSVDGGPKLVTFVVDGQLNDGGAARQYGWGRFPRDLGDVNGAERAVVAPSIHGDVRRLRVYTRCLRTSEAVGNFQAGA